MTDVLHEAHGLIRGERLQTYGPPTKNFRRIAEGWSAYLGYGAAIDELLEQLDRVGAAHDEEKVGGLTKLALADLRLRVERLKREVTVNDVCALMVILKQMRQADGYHRDSCVDTCGYAGLQEVLEEGVQL